MGRAEQGSPAGLRVPRLRRLLCAALLATLVASSAAARPAAERHALWEIHGAKNTVYLLGSIHLLQPQDSSLPAEMLDAYRNADALLMELDPDDLDAGVAAPDVVQLMVLPAGQTLDGVIGARLYSLVQRHAAAIGLGRDGLKYAQPWYAANVIDLSYLIKSGFDPAAGVERQFARLAGRDSKPIYALETAGQQLGYFAAMPLGQQRDLLRDTLRDLPSSLRDASATVRAWKRGDVGALERDLRRSSRQSPDLQPMLVDERNRKWLPQILDLLDDERNYLVVVGALHIVGREGLLKLLKEHGYSASQH